ncbi:hypothetical protein BC938DRAFT_483342 [Jimgerdemannia flammicorona]|uniref:Uncharacterized protein n=1 Tax=Jimgerdemannia flammicorona TaxID=994334 RepID=A0A433QC38_9FUNG|nr:hypothetical protein BC938DRAFT_483342 [Jimgerdemannia flammicorona]
MYSAKTPGSSHGFRVVMPDFFRGKPVPILLLPFKDETDLCHYHGWAAARGNYADPLNKQRATEALQL